MAPSSVGTEDLWSAFSDDLTTREVVLWTVRMDGERPKVRQLENVEKDFRDHWIASESLAQTVNEAQILEGPQSLPVSRGKYDIPIDVYTLWNAGLP